MPMQAQTASLKVQFEMRTFSQGTPIVVPSRPAPALERDTVIAGYKFAAIDHDVLTGVHVDTIGPAMNRHVLERDLFAVNGMGRPHIVAPA